MTPQEKKKAIDDFMTVIDRAELQALSNTSLERPLTDTEFARMIQLSEELLLRAERKEGNI